MSLFVILLLSSEIKCVQTLTTEEILSTISDFSEQYLQPLEPFIVSVYKIVEPLNVVRDSFQLLEENVHKTLSKLVAPFWKDETKSKPSVWQKVLNYGSQAKNYVTSPTAK